jgi:peptidoglycan hydrolase FlgJ
MKIDNTGFLAIDPSQHRQIHMNLSDQESLKLAASQFEAIFLQLVLKSMHATTDTLADGDGLFGSNEQQVFRDMYDAQISQTMAASGQLGLAEAMVRQLGSGLASAEEKFKSMAEWVALPSESEQISEAIYPGHSFAQPLITLPGSEGIN